jgi:hypothetical protein
VPTQAAYTEPVTGQKTCLVKNQASASGPWEEQRGTPRRLARRASELLRSRLGCAVVARSTPHRSLRRGPAHPAPRPASGEGGSPVQAGPGWANAASPRYFRLSPMRTRRIRNSWSGWQRSVRAAEVRLHGRRLTVSDLAPAATGEQDQQESENGPIPHGRIVVGRITVRLSR